MEHPIYTAIVLDNPEILKTIYPTDDENKFYHHVTLRFRPFSKPVFNGKRVQVKLVAIYQDEFAHAAAVEIMDSEVAKYCENKNPHITFSTKNSVKPVYSNFLIKNGNPIPVEKELILDGTVGSFIDGKWDYHV